MTRSKRRLLISYIVMFCLFAFIFFLGLKIGIVKLDFASVMRALFGHGSERDLFIIFELRMPRLIMTSMMGASLALSGSVLQTITKNDLADPGIIGINAGAGFGVAIAYLLLDFNNESIIYMIPIFGFMGAIVTFLISLRFSREESGMLDMNKLVLIGIGSAISLSGGMIVLVSSAGREDVQFIYKWLSGSIWGDKWIFVKIGLPLVVILVTLIIFKWKILDLMALDDISSQSIGVSLKKERRYLIISSIALASIVVSLAGSISFVGLIVPHISKKIFGLNHNRNLIGSLFIGACLLMSADIVGRNIFLPQGVLPGIVVSILGAPYFLYLIIKED